MFSSNKDSARFNSICNSVQGDIDNIKEMKDNQEIKDALKILKNKVLDLEIIIDNQNITS